MLMNAPLPITSRQTVTCATRTLPTLFRKNKGLSRSRLTFLYQKRQYICGELVTCSAQEFIAVNANSVMQMDGSISPGLEKLEEAVDAIRAGKVIAVPTDTLYGFACDACSLKAVNNIYEIKGRKYTSPLAICVAEVADISQYATVDHLPNGLLDSLLPGPVTVVLPRGESSILEKSLNPGLDSIGVRVPDSDFIRAIARKSGIALALTSANLSGKASSVSINDFKDLWRHCAYVYDGGFLPSGRAGSTVVELMNPRTFKILRPGSAREETITILSKFNMEEVS